MNFSLQNFSKVWLSVLLYFAVIELIVIFTKPSLFLNGNLMLTRGIFVAFFLICFFLKDRLPKKFFDFLQVVGIYALLSLLYKETAVFNTLLFPKIDGFLAHLDEKLFGFQPAIAFSEHFNSLFFIEIMFFGYFCYYLMPISTLLILLKKIPEKIEEFGFLFITSFLVYYLIFIFLPAEGPQFYFPFPENSIEAKGLVGTLIKIIQKNGEAPTAAFPSSHVGIAVIVLIWLYNNLKNWAKYFLPFVVLLCFSTVYIKAHYFVDVVAGIISAPIVYYIVSQLYKFSKRNYAGVILKES